MRDRARASGGGEQGGEAERTLFRGVIIPVRLFILWNSRHWLACGDRHDLSPERLVIEADLLIVGGTDSSTPAAAQAARMGLKKIVVVNDIEWFGGQWSGGGLSMIDEFAMYRGRRGLIQRTGMHRELIDFIRHRNRERFGMASPGNARAYQGTLPSIAAEAFRSLIAPFEEGGTGQVQVFQNYRPIEVKKSGNQVKSVVFESSTGGSEKIEVAARLTIDASDWGDVIRLSGAAYFTGADPKSRFGERDAPERPEEELAAEMNAINWCPVVREAGRDATIPKPPGYDERLYYNSSRLTEKEFRALGFPAEAVVGKALPFADSISLGGYTIPGIDNTYLHRRLVDRRHNELKPDAVDTVVIVRPPQDYPVADFPKELSDALEADERGASHKNIVDMTYRQRELVWAHAKNYYLGYIYFLQTKAHELMGDYPESYKYMELSDDFGTPDKLPPKPYIREGLRLHALYMARRQDYDAGVPMNSPEAGWNFARTQFPDVVFSWQSWFDFHPTRRVYLNNDRAQPWCTGFKKEFESTEANRGGFPIRGLVPVEVDGLIGSYINIGHSSLVCSGLRWHSTMPGVGQASAALATVAIRHGVQPREVARNFKMIREVQKDLIKPPGGAPGLGLVHYQDLSPDLDSDRLFEAANFLGIRGILTPRQGTLDFEPYATVTRRELARAVARAARTIVGAKPYFRSKGRSILLDVPTDDPDRTYIESLHHWGLLGSSDLFRPDDPADWPTLYNWAKALGWAPNEGLVVENFRMDGNAEHLKKPTMWRWDLAVHLWAAIKDLPEHLPESPGYLSAGHDADGDGVADIDDPLPFDADDNNLCDWMDPQKRV